MSLVFGIYPGGAAGGDSGLLSGPANNAALVKSCLDDLRGSHPIVVRCYDSFQDPGSPLALQPCNPEDYPQYARPGTPLELVLQFRSELGNVPGYLDFVRHRIARHSKYLYAVQITEEANFTNGPNVIDGPYPNVLQALTEGVIAAKQILRKLGRADVKVGFNATPTFGPSASFWSSLRPAGIPFLEALDYVGLDFFPDVFRPISPADIAASVTGILQTMRANWLAEAGIPPTVPIHITEHGWPTSEGRTWERQAEILETVVRTLDSLSGGLHIERYTLFGLRDVDRMTAANASNLFHFFGITTADYRRKAAFETFRKLIAELSPPHV